MADGLHALIPRTVERNSHLAIIFGRKTLVEWMSVAVNSEKSSLMVFAIVYVGKPGHFGKRSP